MKRLFTTKQLAVTAIMGAVATVLMFLEFPIPFMPPFLKMDISDLPALITSFALGPIFGVLVELIKNLIHVLSTQTGGAGEIGNFLIGCALVVPAGLIYKKYHSKKGALWGLVIGSISMLIMGFLANYYITIPVYVKMMPLEQIIAIANKVNSMIVDMKTLIIFGMVPFNLIKAIILSIITMLTYKKLSGILR